jgi:hypothetical protein
MKLMNNKKMAHSNAWHSLRETTEGLKKSRGKVYSLLVGQCTSVDPIVDLWQIIVSRNFN